MPGRRLGGQQRRGGRGRRGIRPDPHWAALGNFLATLAALALGYRLGAGPAGRLLGKYALPLSGLLLILLGVWEMLG